MLKDVVKRPAGYGSIAASLAGSQNQQTPARWRVIMKLSRRAFVGGALAAPFLAKPGFGQARGSVLSVIPHADLKILDPICTTAYITRNHGYMVYDTLFAMDESLKPQPQMVDTFEARPTASPTRSCCATA